MGMGCLLSIFIAVHVFRFERRTEKPVSTNIFAWNSNGSHFLRTKKTGSISNLFSCLVFSKQTLYRIDRRISAGLPPFAKEKPRLKRTWAERIGVIPTLWGTIIPMSIFSRSVLLDPAHFWCQILINHIGTCSLLDSCRLAVLLINWFSNLLIKEF